MSAERVSKALVSERDLATLIPGVLRGLKEVAGVTGCWLYDRDGQIAQADVPKLYDPDMLGDSTAIIGRVAESIEFHYGSWDSFTVEYPRGALLIRNLNPGGLVIMATREANLGFVNVAANVAVGKLLKAASESAGMASLSHPPSTAALIPADSGSTPLSSTGNAPVPPDGVSDVFMDDLNRTLAEFMGPASTILIKRTLKKMGVGGSRAPRSGVRQLVDQLEERIPRPADRAKFRAAAHKLARFHKYE